jgi:hypothetical protein
MKICKTLIFFIGHSWVCVIACFAQQASPIDMILEPEKNRIFISSVGGGNVEGYRASDASVSAQVAMSWNFWNRVTPQSIKTGSLMFKLNPMINNRILKPDSLSLWKVPFSDNEQLFFIGLRQRKLMPLKSTNTRLDSITRKRNSLNQDNLTTKQLLSWFIDCQFTPFNLTNTKSNFKFNTINANAGFTYGIFDTDPSWGRIGISGSVQLNYLKIIDEVSQRDGFELAMNSKTPLPRRYGGIGLKITLHLNDVAVFFEIRNYAAFGRYSNADNPFNDIPVITYGSTLTGNLLRNTKR